MRCASCSESRELGEGRVGGDEADASTSPSKHKVPTVRVGVVEEDVVTVIIAVIELVEALEPRAKFVPAIAGVIERVDLLEEQLAAVDRAPRGHADLAALERIGVEVELAIVVVVDPRD